MAIIRWLLYTLAGLVLLLAAAVAAAILLIDTRDIQNTLAEQIEDRTGREVDFKGELSLSFFPWLGFELAETRVANAQGFKEDGPFATVGTVELRVKVLPLLQRQVVLDNVVLREVEVNAGIGPDGQPSWADIEERLGQPPDESAPADGTEPGGDGGTAPDPAAELPFDVRVEGFELADTALHWRDREAGTAFNVRDLNLTTGPLALGEATPLALSVDFEPADGPNIALELDTNTRVTLAPMAAELSDLVVDVSASGAELPRGGLAARLQADIGADLAAGEATIDPLQLQIAETANAEGRLRLTFGGATPQLDGELAVDQFSPRELADRFDIELPPTADDDVLRALTLSLRFDGTPERIDVSDIAINLDDTRLDGDLALSMANKPRIEANFQGDAIDIDRYMADREKAEIGDIGEQDKDNGEQGDGGDPIAELPLEALRAVDAEAIVGFDRVGYTDLDLTDATFSFTLDNGLLTLRDSGGNIAGGRIGLAGTFDARGGEPAIDVSTTIDSVRSQSLVEAFFRSSPVLGELDTSLSLQAAGGSLQDWLDDLDGEFRSTFLDGALRGINVGQALRNRAASLRGQAETESSKSLTPFANFSAAGQIRDGMLETRSFSLEGDSVRGSGEGDIDLARQQIDYTTTFSLLESSGVDESIAGLDIPIRLSGSLFAPKVSIDVVGALERRARQEGQEAEEKLRRELDEEKEEARQKLEEEEARAREKLEQEEAKARQQAEEEEVQARQKLEEERDRAKEKIQDQIKGLFD